MGHPAHFHLLKNTIHGLEKNGHECIITCKKKDILEELLANAGLSYFNILKEGRKDNKFSILIGVIKRDWRLFNLLRKNRVDVMIGTSIENSHIGKLLNIPSVNLNEDDASVAPMYARFSYPFSSVILSPTSCDNGRWNSKSIKYRGYHELAYLHPNNFIADRNVVKKHINITEPYFIIRFAKLTAHHDKGVSGIDSNMARRIIQLLSNHGNIYITSERPLEPEFEIRRISIDPLDIHHILAFAKIYIGDSQTMAAEAGVLGIPFIRVNDFAGRIGIFNEMEDQYELGYGFKPNEHQKIYDTISTLLENETLEEIFQARRIRMLKEKIDYSKYLTWFLELYPNSVSILKENPEFPNQFI